MCAALLRSFLTVHMMGMVDAPTVILVTALATAGGLIGWLVQLSIATLFFLGILIGAYGGVLVAVGVGLWDTPEARAQVRTRSSKEHQADTQSASYRLLPY